MTSSTILSTGLTRCYNKEGVHINCQGSGQDGELRTGTGWPAKRFKMENKDLVQDIATGLFWAKDSCQSEYPLNWQEGLIFIEQMNKEKRYGRNDWRMPNRLELRSIIDHNSKKPAITVGHPFDNIFLGWFWTSTHSPAISKEHPFSDVQESYWSSTTSTFETDWAYVLYLRNGAVGVGYKKNSDFTLWPVMSITSDK